MKVIGLSGGYINVNGIKRVYVNEDYVQAVLKAGATPLILPLCEDINVIKQMIACLDGLIITGGEDIHPSYYHEEPLTVCGEFDYHRDCYEFMLMAAFEATNKPILGICRGAQALNVYFGGTLYQDLSLKLDCTIMHRQTGSRGFGCHAIEVVANQFLGSIYQSGDLINSYHHQAVKDLGKGLVIAAISKDGVIEAFQHQTKPIYAVQFHPEVMVENDKKALQLFKQFVERIES